MLEMELFFEENDSDWRIFGCESRKLLQKCQFVEVRHHLIVDLFPSGDKVQYIPISANWITVDRSSSNVAYTHFVMRSSSFVEVKKYTNFTLQSGHIHFISMSRLVPVYYKWKLL